MDDSTCETTALAGGGRGFCHLGEELDRTSDAAREASVGGSGSATAPRFERFRREVQEATTDNIDPYAVAVQAEQLEDDASWRLISAFRFDDHDDVYFALSDDLSEIALGERVRDILHAWRATRIVDVEPIEASKVWRRLRRAGRREILAALGDPDITTPDSSGRTEHPGVTVYRLVPAAYNRILLRRLFPPKNSDGPGTVDALVASLRHGLDRCESVLTRLRVRRPASS